MQKILKLSWDKCTDVVGMISQIKSWIFGTHQAPLLYHSAVTGGKLHHWHYKQKNKPQENQGV